MVSTAKSTPPFAAKVRPRRHHSSLPRLATTATAPLRVPRFQGPSVPSSMPVRWPAIRDHTIFCRVIHWQGPPLPGPYIRLPFSSDRPVYKILQKYSLLTKSSLLATERFYFLTKDFTFYRKLLLSTESFYFLPKAFTFLTPTERLLCIVGCSFQ